ncbi:MAG: hypothetical protein AB1801_00730 [Chloroflexota bacterium]
MAKEKELVRSVRYVFSATDLSLNLSDLSRYNIDESIQKYISLCQEELQQIYPQAVIEVIDSDSTMGATETYVEALDNFEETPDLDEIEVVKDICNRIFDQRNWFVWQNFVPIIEVKDDKLLPLSIIRWACANGLIEGTSKSTGYWRILSDDIPKIRKLVVLVKSQEHLENLPVRNFAVACFLEDMKFVPIVAIPEDFKLLVVSSEGFNEDLFKPDTSLFLIRRMGHQAEIEVEHFVDSVEWSDSPWRYPTYAGALAHQAKRKGMDCKTQLAERNERQEIDGISFRLLKDVMPELTLQNLVEESLLALSEVISDAELSLNGGPVWDDQSDEIYQKDERRFCEEVLAKLLEKMEFKIVRYIHGGDEYGRDFIFEETTPFFRSRYYGLQAKAGNISGKAKSKIDMILSQVEDAFAMPYTKEPGRPDIYIDTMIIAISGEFAPNAIDKIRHKTPQYLVGSLFFWDKKTIRSLISQYWQKEKD